MLTTATMSLERREAIVDIARRFDLTLVEDGVFFLDAYGGYESYRVTKERTKFKGFTYIWDQATFNPVDSLMDCHIHFEFPDGSRLNKAFRYDWRLWTIPELRDLLQEVGFGEVTCLWEGTDRETNEGNGIYRPASSAPDDPAYVSYLVAAK